VRRTGKVLQAHVAGDGHAPRVYLQYLETTSRIGHSNFDLSVKSTGPPERGIDSFRTIGSGDHHNLSARLEAVH